MQVKEIMTKNFEMINSTESLTDAAKKMKSLNVGVLPVREGNKIIGIVTDRDMVVRGLAENKEPKDSSVKDVMSSEVARCSSEGDIEEAARVMEANKVRRLLVLDNENTPVGILSLGDIAAKTESEQLTGHTLEAVSQPCSPCR
jgi:CBS domain-containing protein